MPVELKGSCRCGEVAFSALSHTPYPYMRCYCSICRKLSGGGGYTINIMAVTETLQHSDTESLGTYRVVRDGETSLNERRFCTLCGSMLWGWHPDYPELFHPFASAIDTELPVPPTTTHIMLASKAKWVEPEVAPDDLSFDAYPDQSIEDWHKSRGLWVA